MVEKVAFKKRFKNKRKIRQNYINDIRSGIKNSTTHGLPYIVNQELHWIERYAAI